MSTELAEAPAAAAVSTATATEPTPVVSTQNDIGTLDRLEQFKAALNTPAPAPVENKAPAQEPAATPAPAAKPSKDPLGDIAPEPTDKTFNLPLDDEDDAPVATDEKEDLPDNIKEGTPQAAAFRTLRKEKQEIARQRDAFQAELDQLKTRSTELEGERTIREELEQKVKEYEAKLNVTRIEDSPVFQKAVTEPARKIGEATEKFASQYGVDLRQLDQVFDIADEGKRKVAFRELFSGMDIDPEDGMEIRALAKEFRTIVGKRDEILADSEKTLAELEAIQQRQHEREAALRADERRVTTKQVADHTLRKLPILKALEGFDFDKAAQGVGETDLDSLDLPNKAYNSMAGQALPKLAKAYQQAMKQLEEMSDELEKIRNSSPRPGGSMPVSVSKTASSVSAEGETVVDRFKKTFGR